MDVTFSNVLEGTRQYFMGLPKQAQAEGSGQPIWSAMAPPTEESAPAQSGAPTSRPPSTAAATPAVSSSEPTSPPRPPSEPLEPEPHIIHKATVMREAAEKRKIAPETEDEDEAVDALSPPPHIIRKPMLPLPSPAPAPAAPSPSPARPSSNTISQTDSEHIEPSPLQYHQLVSRAQLSTDHYVTPSRPPEQYPSYPYESTVHIRETDIGKAHRQIVASAQSTVTSRHSPQQTYARISSSMAPNYGRIRDADAGSHAHRYPVANTRPNDRVPPIHYSPTTLSNQRNVPADRANHTYPAPHRPEPLPYSRTPHYDRHANPALKYDHAQLYPTAFRSGSTNQCPSSSNRLDPHIHHSHRQHRDQPPIPTHVKPQVLDNVHKHLNVKPSNHIQTVVQRNENARVPSLDIQNARRTTDSRTADAGNSYYPASPTTSNVKHGSPLSVTSHNVPNSTYNTKSLLRSGVVVPKSHYDPTAHNSVKGTVKAYPSQQNRMTVSVTSLVNQMNQTKQKRESPLDLSVKTVKNSADSSTTPEDVAECISTENILYQRSPLLQPNVRSTVNNSPHKVDFAPDFNQYRNQSSDIHDHYTPRHHGSTSFYNGSYETPKSILPYHIESHSHTYSDKNKHSIHTGRNDHVTRIDLTRSIEDKRIKDNRIKNDRNLVIQERKRSSGPVNSNIPEKLVRYETWSADSRIERMRLSAREQQELMSRPVYSYSSLKRLEATQNEQKKHTLTHAHSHNPHEYYVNHRYSAPHEQQLDQHHRYYDKNAINHSRHIIQKVPSQKDLYSHNLDQSGIPANKRVLSILRNSLETKHTASLDNAKHSQQIPDLIVIDDADDVIEITDLTKESNSETSNITKPCQKSLNQSSKHNIKIPKAIDSLPVDSEYQKLDELETKSKSPENDVSFRIRTKAELKVMPPTQETPTTPEISQERKMEKIIPKSQKQHLFNQIREDNLRLESIIKNSAPNTTVPEVKSEPTSTEDSERNLEIKHMDKSTKTFDDDLPKDDTEEDLWSSACNNFLEQLKQGCHKKKMRKKRSDTLNSTSDISKSADNLDFSAQSLQPVVIKKEPYDEYEFMTENSANEVDNEIVKKSTKLVNKPKTTDLINGLQSGITPNNTEARLIHIKEEITENESLKNVIKEEDDSTDDDVPLIKSKLMKDKEQSERNIKYQMLKDLSEKSAYVKLECCNVDLKNSRKLSSSLSKTKQEKTMKQKPCRGKTKTLHDNKKESSSDSDENLSVACRLRLRKTYKSDDTKNTSNDKLALKLSPKNTDSSVASSTPLRKTAFGDNSSFHPGWEEELYRYKRSIRMPTRLIAIPRGGSGGPNRRRSNLVFNRGSTSLPDLDTVPLSPAPSSTPSAATDDYYLRPTDKNAPDSDLESNYSYSIAQKLHYDSEASTSTVFSSTKNNSKSSSIVDVLIQKCARKDELKKIEKCGKMPKCLSKYSNTLQSFPTSSPVQSNSKEIHMNKQKVRDLYNFSDIDNKKGSVARKIEEPIKPNNKFSAVDDPKTRTVFKSYKHRATIKEVFGDERPASAPPSSLSIDSSKSNTKQSETKTEKRKLSLRSKRMSKDKTKNNNSIRDCLRSTKSLKRNDAKGRLMRLNKRNNLIKSLATKRLKEIHGSKPKDIKRCETKIEHKKEKSTDGDQNRSRKLRRIFSRRKFSSGFDYIRKKKKIVRGDGETKKKRKVAAKPTPESVHDIHREIKSWFINKSVGESHLHRAARLGYIDCVAYCLEKMNAEPSARDNAGFTPLHVAAARGHVRIARLLLQYGANVSAAAQGGVRPLHEACESSSCEMIRLLLAYGADPALGTYAGATPEQLAAGPAARLLRLHLADVQGRSHEPWTFPPPTAVTDPSELGCDPLSSPPPASPPPPAAAVELHCTDAPLPPFYTLRPADGLWCLLTDVTNLLQIKSKESLLKQIHCGPGSPRELLREVRTQEFLERAQCSQLLSAGEKVNVRASKVALIRVTDKLRQLLNIETVLVS